MNSAYLAGLQTMVIGIAGELLTVERRPSTAGGDPTFQTIRFIVEEMQDDNTSSLKAEGDQNVAVGAQKMFICSLGSDVRAVKDTILYEGLRWRVNQVTADRHGGADLMKMCVAANAGKA